MYPHGGLIILIGSLHSPSAVCHFHVLQRFSVDCKMKISRTKEMCSLF